jgi:hypothetical protein
MILRFPLRAPPDLKLTILNTNLQQVSVQDPITDMWCFNHSTSTDIYVYS